MRGGLAQDSGEGHPVTVGGGLPRSARLSLWAGAALAGHVAWADVVAAVSRDDEPHAAARVGASPGPTGPVSPMPPMPSVPGSVDSPPHGADTDIPGGLAGLLGVARACGLNTLGVVLPVPGDLVGLPGPAGVNRAATDAGECVVADLDGRRWVLVPYVRRFGSPLEPGHLVTWRVHDADPRPLAGAVTLPDADKELRVGLLEAVDELARLDVARWRDEVATDLEFVRTGALPGWLLPPGTHPRQVAVLASALKVRVIIGLARKDDGGSLGAWDAGRRDDVLRRLDGIARRAIVAACSHRP